MKRRMAISCFVVGVFVAATVFLGVVSRQESVASPAAAEVCSPQPPPVLASVPAANALNQARTKLDERLKEKREALARSPSERLASEIAALEELKKKLDSVMESPGKAEPGVEPKEPAIAETAVSTGQVVVASVESASAEKPVGEAGMSDTKAKTMQASATTKKAAELLAAQEVVTEVAAVCGVVESGNTAEVREKLMADLKPQPVAPVVPEETEQAATTVAGTTKSAEKVAQNPLPAPASESAGAEAAADSEEVRKDSGRQSMDVGIASLGSIAAKEIVVQADFAGRTGVQKSVAEKGEPASSAAPGDVSPKYEGDWRDGKMSGQGAFTFVDGRQYVGQWANGVMEGLGQYTVPGKWQYVGEWHNGRVDGDGILTHSTGWKYVGQWRDGKREGHGTLTCSDGWEYIGTWTNGLMSGRGSLKQPGVGEFDGEWRDGRRDGQGVFTYADSGKYVGEWRADKRNGMGTLSYPDGWKYEGQWADDKLDGKGTLAYPDGGRYVGEWRADRRSGTGSLNYPDGWKYDGSWVNDKPEGQGTLVHPDGWTYSGEWREGKMSGRGQMTQQGKSPATK